MNCVCSHPRRHHLNDGPCLHAAQCGCPSHQPDTDTPEDPQAVCYPKLGNHQPYTGKYGRHG